jgi:hypothetical protein
MDNSKGHVEFIDGHEYYIVSDKLYRAKLTEPLGKDGRRPGDFVTLGSGVDWALRIARMQAGLPEFK